MKMKSPPPFDKGALWESIVKTAAHALAIGALRPIPTDYEFIEGGGMRFFVRILSNLERKDEERKKQDEKSRKVDPFSPCEKDLFVADISGSHLAVLNKFNVLEHHLLIVTKEMEGQDDLLTERDFEAMCICLNEYEGLGFYNGGEAAGASQSHKHLQLVPLPLAPEGPRIPIEPLLKGARFKGELGMVPGFPFLHAYARFDPDLFPAGNSAVEKTFDLYCKMLRHVGLKAPSAKKRQLQSAPYCLIVTREWMLLVPRSMEFFEGVSINSLGYAGALLVRNKEQLALLKRLGPMTALKKVAI